MLFQLHSYFKKQNKNRRKLSLNISVITACKWKKASRLRYFLLIDIIPFLGLLKKSLKQKKKSLNKEKKRLVRDHKHQSKYQ